MSEQISADEVEPHRIEAVQHPQTARWVPPILGLRRKAANFTGVDCGAVPLHRSDPHRVRQKAENTEIPLIYGNLQRKTPVFRSMPARIALVTYCLLRF